MIKHIVLTKFADPDRSAPAAAAMLKELQKKIPGIVSLEVGLDLLGSERSYDMGLIVVFRNKEELLSYADHPDHIAVREYIRANRTATASVDFEY